jgi:hypothetical protein
MVDRQTKHSLDIHVISLLSMRFFAISSIKCIMSTRRKIQLALHSMAMAFHESRVVIIETGRRVVRAGLGLGELLHVPSVVSFSLCSLPTARFSSLNPAL